MIENSIKENGEPDYSYVLFDEIKAKICSEVKGSTKSFPLSRGVSIICKVT